MPTSSIAPWTNRLTPVDSPRMPRMSVSSPTMPFFEGSDCISAWNIPISHAVPSSTDGPSRIASMEVLGYDPYAKELPEFMKFGNCSEPEDGGT